MAKSLAGGFPLSGVIGRAAIMDAAGARRPRRHLCAASPVACAAALAVLDVIEEEKLLERADAVGARIKARLDEAWRGATTWCPSPRSAASAPWSASTSSRSAAASSPTPRRPSG